MKKKVDNSALQVKLALRRTLLTDAVADGWPLHVLDCCAGFRGIWGVLEREFELGSYIGLDLRRTIPGVLSVDSKRWLRDCGVSANVIDVDTYGDPWDHWRLILRGEWKHPEIIVFLTAGLGMGPQGKIGGVGLDMAGLPRDWRDRLPMTGAVRALVTESCLTRCYDYGIIPIRCVEAANENGWTRYFGLHLRRDGHASNLRAEGQGAGVQSAGAERLQRRM